MRTMRDIITRAARLIGQTGVDEVLDADAGAEGLVILNDLFHMLPIPDYADLDYGDPAPVAAALIEDAVIVFAARFAPVFGLAGPDPAASLARLRASVMTIPTAQMPTGLSRMPSQRRYHFR